MKTLSIKCHSTLLDRIGEFTLSKKQIKIFTGLSWENLFDIKDSINSLHNSQSRSVIQALIVFLFELRTGNSNKLLASIFNINNEQSISEYSKSIIQFLGKNVLPLHFALNSFNRDNLIQNHTTEIAKKLFDVQDNLLLIYDGTYARHQKSTNNEYQRKSFYGQKKVLLYKPFIICTTDRYEMDMLGPYPATQNDEDIMKTIIKDPNGLCKFLRTNDVFVLDQGFRDVVRDLEANVSKY